MKSLTLVALLLALAGCGVDGAPMRPAAYPAATTATPGVSVTGNARIGVMANDL